ncbi:MAG: zf-HC2 domain-containing protein [Betaproteobacteria bacterium]|nr:zf-HC2 domain-containing protein [Betaproteobacteria bacterium]
MLSCRDVTHLCSEEHERRLGLGVRLALRLHLMMCRGCSNFRAQMDFLNLATRRWREGGRPDGEPPEGEPHEGEPPEGERRQGPPA